MIHYSDLMIFLNCNSSYTLLPTRRLVYMYRLVKMYIDWIESLGFNLTTNTKSLEVKMRERFKNQMESGIEKAKALEMSDVVQSVDSIKSKVQQSFETYPFLSFAFLSFVSLFHLRCYSV